MAVGCGCCRLSLLSLIIFSSWFLQHIKYASSVAAEITAVFPKATDERVKISAGIVESLVDVKTSLRVVGWRLSEQTSVVLTKASAIKSAPCNDFARSKVYTLQKNSPGVFEIDITLSSSGKYYLCVKNNDSNWLHSGADDVVTIKIGSKGGLPLWLQVILLVVLLCLSGLFSGLNLGLMALDPTELKVVTTCGNANEQKYAKKIIPVRNHGNYLLCTLLMGNVLVNSSLTILLDGVVGSGIIAVVVSTAGIVVFGEIVPQSVCSRHGLAIGANTLYLTKLFMLLTFPLSYPISKLLDFVLGEELGTIYNRKQLLEMIKVTAEHNDLAGDEMNIISGVLNYKTKCVNEIMTTLEDCFLLDAEEHLDFATITTIMESGHSRIPVYTGERQNIVGLLFVKDLAFVDPDDCLPLPTVIKFYNHPVHFVWDDTNLGDLLDTFKEKHSHITIVRRVNNEGPGDPFYEAIGLATLEDVIEEMIQSDIVDETDKYIDNKKLIANPQRNSTGKYNIFITDEISKTSLSPQLQLATFQYLTTAVKAFSEERIAPNVLKQLLKQEKVVVEIKVNEASKEELILYKKEKPAEYFTMLVQGHVDVTVGMEAFHFTHGAFSCFCEGLLLGAKAPYIPDFSVQITSDVMFIKITPEIYKQALLSTKLKTWENEDASNDSTIIINDNRTETVHDTEETPILKRTTLLPKTV